MKNKKVMLAAGIIVIAFGIRAPIAAVGSLAGWISEDLGVPNSVIGLLTTIPLIAFAVGSPFIGKISGRTGIGKAMLLGLLLMIGGILFRSYGGTVGLFAGTAIMGMGIVFANVLLPGIVKWKFSERVGMMTGLYTGVMALFSGIAAGISVPLAQSAGLGWKHTLAIWALLTAAGILLWLPQINALDGDRLKESEGESRKKKKRDGKPLYKSPIACWVTVFMGVQSFLFYCFAAWLPAMIQGKGFDAETAGYYALLFQWASIPASVGMPVLADRYKDQRKITLVCMVAYFIGVSIFLVTSNPQLLGVSIGFAAIGSGASFSLAMCFIAMRARDAEQASQLSGLAQSAGYFAAALGPITVGAVSDLTGSWTVPILIFIGLTVVLIISGYQSGKDEYV